MTGPAADPHIHVGADLNADALTRNFLASAFGLVSDIPPVVTSGCGRQVPRAMTSPHPERVTCLACREHAARQHLRHAEQAERLIGMPGITVSAAELRAAADAHRDLAARFSGPDT